MNDAKALHREAMDLADRAELARRAGDSEAARALFAQAARKERQAASSVDIDVEPTRSVLLRSAASLFLDCEEFPDAERAIATALSGNPPESIGEELRDLLETVYFRRHLSLRGVRLLEDEFQFSIEGKGIGFGIAPAESFLSRVRDIESLIYRTAERRLGKPFREVGRRIKKLDERLQLFVSTPRAASFAVTFRIGSSSQLDLPAANFASEVVDEVLQCFDLVNEGKVVELEVRMEEEAYFNNFIALASRIAPDGDVVSSVGLTAVRSKDERSVVLTRRKENMPAPRRRRVESSSTIDEPIEIQGLLLEADAKRQEYGQIEIQTPTGSIERVFVPRGMMRDIVRPLFEEDVVVEGIRTKEGIMLKSIRLSELGN